MTPDAPEPDRRADPEPVRGALDPDRWLEQYGDFLFSMAFLRLRDRGAAEDAVQETLLAAWKSRERYAGRSSERTWLVGILKRKIVDHLRQVFRERPIEESTEGNEIEDAGHYYPTGKWRGHWIPEEGPADWGDNPQSLLERKEFWEALEGCLNGLPPRLAAVFVLYEMEDMPAETICRELEITPTNLWVMLHRARKQLRLCLERTWIGPQAG